MNKHDITSDSELDSVQIDTDETADNIDILHKEEDDSGIVGEYDQDTADDIDLVSQAKVSKCVTDFPLSKELKEVAEKRIANLILLDKLEEKRAEYKSNNDLEANIVSELSRQSGELRALPEKTALADKYKQFQTRVDTARTKHEQAKEDAIVEGKAKPDFVITPQMQTTWKFANEQYKLLFERQKIARDIMPSTMKYLKNEPLYNMLSASGYAAEKLFTFSIYCLALESWSQNLKNTRKTEQLHTKELNNKKSGIFRRVNKDIQDEISKSESISTYCSSTITTINREIKSLEKQMIDEFWKCYEFCSCLLVSKKLDKKREAIVRVFLRYSLIGHSPWFISPEISQALLKDCIEDVKSELPFSQVTDKILYADEYLEHVVANTITPSIDEELELTGKNTPAWHADKAARRLSYSKERAFLLNEVRNELVGKIKKLRKKQLDEEERVGKILKSAPDYKKQKATLLQSIQRCKVESARYERIITKITDIEIPDLKEKALTARDRVDSSGVKRGAFEIVRKEAKAIHRVCRLCARLKDPFLPFVLRESYNNRPDILNNREEMSKIVGHIEYADKHIFQEVLVNTKKITSRIYLRVAPVILITPSCGFMGYSWNPRSGVESGKMVVPGYCPRSNVKERMIYNMVADFRWDTSKAEAGIDLLTSDTLVAAYSSCRWNYRKKKKENREKALIFNELNDRTNWRRHYELFLMSAEDSGRKLFYKNYEVYEMILKYIGLPDGLERLRR